MDSFEKIHTVLKDLNQIKEVPVAPTVKGYDFNEGIDYEKLLASYSTMGIQATNFAEAVKITNEFLDWSLADEPIKEDEDEELKDMEVRKSIKCDVFFGYTSNMISSGNREIIRFLVQHKMVKAIVTTCGGIEEDFMKCMAPSIMGDFHADDRDLRRKFLCRIGNMYVPCKNYAMFEDWMMPILDEMHQEQIEKGTIFTPSTIIKRLGEKINNEDSVYYWAAKNDIPVFCPGITDGAIGDLLFCHSFKREGFIIDVVEDVRKICKMVMKSKKSAILTLGGGIIKHHIMNAHCWKNGAEYGVYFNTGLDMEASDAGAMPNEGMTWAKLKLDSKFVKVFSEASLVFPLYVAQTFAKKVCSK